MTQVSVDGRPGVMLHDAGARQAVVHVDGWLRPDGPGSTVYLAGGIPAGAHDFVVVGDRIRPRPVPPLPGPLTRVRQALRRRRRLLTASTAVLVVAVVVRDGRDGAPDSVRRVVRTAGRWWNAPPAG